ncbi:RHS repeat-associated core domain-containing protein [Pseudomonas rustica]
MASTPGVHSNATNFQSFVQNHVDQRTGQYNLAIDLQVPTGNDLTGPGLPLRLSYSPFNDADSGFGTGWQLAMTQYVPATQMLTLHTGESYKVTGTGPQPSMREKKVHSFHFYDDGYVAGSNEPSKGPYRVVHKSGLVETLTLHDVVNPIALTKTVRAPSGHGISLSYLPENRRLEKIVDDNGTLLLSLNYTDGRVTIDAFPGAGADDSPFMRYMLELKNRELVEVKLPPEVGGNWRFGYTTVHGLKCLAKVSTPLGAVEEIRYGEDDPGHLLPGTRPQRALPRVTTHEVKPRADQPPLKTTYTYQHFDEALGIWQDNSFVGSNSGITWRDDGEDNLYRAQSSYRYSVTAHYWKADKVARKQTQTFNPYHLLTLQTLEQDGHVEETETVFHQIAGNSFEDQPRYFQLPKTITKRWKLRDDAAKLHVETASTTYDDYGNVTEEQAPTGVRTTYEYYDKDGEKNTDGTWACPPDPQSFIRNLKCKTVYPVQTLPGDAPVQRTRLTYKAYPTLSSLGEAGEWLAPCEEQILQVLDQPDEGEQLLIKVERAYLNMPGNAFLHGRPDYQVTTRYGEDNANPVRRAMESRSSRIEWGYRKVDDKVHGLEYWTDETVSGFDLVQKKSSMAASGLHGQSVYEEDETGNSIRRLYDPLARLVEETVAPGQGVDEAKVFHTYGLVTHPEEGPAGLASQSVTGSTGVSTFITFDGCSRVVKEERETELPGAPATPSGAKKLRQRKLVAERKYDALGQLSEETTYDFYDDKTLTLTSTFEYDAWSRLCKTTLPNGVTQHSEYSPFGEAGDIITRWFETPEKPDVRQQQQVTASNRFDKPAYQYRLDDTGQTVGRHDFSYDGLGRCTSEEHTFKRDNKPVKRVSKYAYDDEGRVTRTERPDQSAVLSEFALHSAAPLAEKLLVERRKGAAPTLAWQRGYDGLDRLTSLTAGVQQENYTYKPNTSLVETRTTRERTFTYHYRPTRSAQPNQIDVNAVKSTTFDYDSKTSSINTASDAQGTHSYTYTDQGYLLKTQWEGQDANGYHCDYRNSLQGLPLGYTESDGVEVKHAYNDLGQLEQTSQGDLIASFEYDTLGRLWKTTTQDNANKQKLVCVQTYDALGREEKREQTLTRHDGSTLTQSIVLGWQEDDQLRTRTLTRDGQELLAETFSYDALDRLEEHTCQGTALPHNAAGRAIKSQFFVYDELNNLIECYTDFADGKSDEAIYTYDGFILKEVTHSLQPDYPASQAFDHDAEGNLLNDEQGNKLVYDDQGRLSEVLQAGDGQPLYRYRYDGHNDLIGVRHEQAAEVARRYQGYRVTSTRDADVLTEYLYAGDRPIGLQRPAQTADNRLFVTDAANSVVGECSGDQLHDNTYTAYGDSPDNDQLVGLLGFNGEARERALGWSLLGRGYRAYNPGLMRFHSPDTAAPEQAGINPYVYCGGNPVNWRDPSGHFGMRHQTELPYVPPQPLKAKGDWRSWLGVALGAVFAVVSFMFLPPVGMTMAFALGAGSLAIDVAATATSVGAIVTGSEAANDSAFWLGIASALSTLGVIAASRMGAKAVGKSIDATTQTTTETASIGVGTRRGSKVVSSAARGVKRGGGTISARPAKIAKIDTIADTSSAFKPSNTLDLDWDVMPPGKKGLVRDNPLYESDTPTSQTPGPSTSTSTPTEVSEPAAGSVKPQSPTRDWSGSAIGAIRVRTLHWPSRNKYSYIPPRNPKYI